MINNNNWKNNNNNRNIELFNPRLNISRARVHIFVTSNRHNHRNRNHGKHTINNFPEIVIGDINKLEEGNKKCVICLEDFVSKEKVTALPWNDFFHTPCIQNGY